MALVKCSRCGNNVSSYAATCPHCGSPMENKVVCPECGASYNQDKDACPECGCPRGVETEGQRGNITSDKPAADNSNHHDGAHRKPVIVALICISVFLIILVIVLLIVNRSTKENITITDRSPMETEEIEETEETSAQEELVKQAIVEVLEGYQTELQNGNFDQSQNYLPNNYNYLEHIPYSISSDQTLQSLFEKCNYEVKTVTVDDKGEKALAVISATHPVYLDILEAATSGWTLSDSSSMEKAVEEKLNDPELKSETTEASLVLVKSGEEWKISVDDYFFYFLYYGISDELTFEKLSDNEKKLLERQQYINDYIELTDFIVEECEGYAGVTPGLSEVSIKNNGDQAIDSLTVTLDFLNEDGSVALTKKIVILGYTDAPIEPGYSWKMQDDKFFEIEYLSEDIDISRVNVYISDVTLSEAKQSSVVSEESKYVSEYLELNDYSVKMYESYSGKKPGLGGVSVKNNGERDIASLTVTVYFQNEEGKNIAEDSFLIIGGYFGGSSLKANYSWKMESDQFYEIQNLADEVDISRHTVEITEIEFE